MRKYSLIQYTGMAIVMAMLFPSIAFADPLRDKTLNDFRSGNLNSYICDALQFGCAKSSTLESPTVNFNLFSHRIRLVKLNDSQSIYAIEQNRKHWLPTEAIFRDYGYDFKDVEIISTDELNSIPRTKLVYKKGDSKHIYYLTETNMLRLIPDKKIIESYGGNASEAIQISEKEFNFYPRNVYIYQESPYNPDIWLLDPDKKQKQYMTPLAAARLQIEPWQVAPVNKTELDAYKTYKPIVN